MTDPDETASDVLYSDLRKLRIARASLAVIVLVGDADMAVEWSASHIGQAMVSNAIGGAFFFLLCILIRDCKRTADEALIREVLDS